MKNPLKSLKIRKNGRFLGVFGPFRWKEHHTAVLTTSAMSCFSIAAFTFAFWIGMVVTGICFLVLEGLSDQ